MQTTATSGWCLVLAMLGAFTLTTPATAQSYTLTDLGALQGTAQGNDTASSPYGLNNLGQAVGTSQNPSAAIATLFSSGKDTNLGFLDGQVGDNVSLASGINVNGEITGSALAGDGTAFHAFVYSGGKMTDIHSASAFPGGSRAAAINGSGQVVGLGYLDSSDASFHVFLYSGGKMVDIGPPGSYQASATDINDAGQVVGSYYTSGTNSGAFLYSNGQFTTLKVPAGATAVGANAINGKGQIAGAIYSSAGVHAASYAAGVWTDLGAIPGATSTQATSINTSGQIAGLAVFPDTGKYPRRIPGKRVAFIVINGAPVDLNTLVPANSGYTVGGNSREGTVRINDSGQILCTATTPAGFEHAVLLTPK